MSHEFVLRHCLGKGGFGEVYLADQKVKNGTQEVALKVLHQGLDPRSQAVQRLRDEARLLRLLDHPSILSIHDLVLLEDRVALVTEYIAGQDLEDLLLPPHTIPIAAGLEVLGQIGQALQTAYTTIGPKGKPLHLLHRDIKPGNIRIGQDGRVKLLDFGIAKATGVTREAKTQGTSVLGSFAYMAPERFDPRSPPSPAGDVYSLGVVLFEILSQGEMLLDGYELRELFSLAMMPERREEVISARIQSLRSVPFPVIEILTRMLANDPLIRPELPTLFDQLDAVAAHAPGLRLLPWARQKSWPDPASQEGKLSGRVLSATSLALVSGRVVPPPPPTLGDSLPLQPTPTPPSQLRGNETIPPPPMDEPPKQPEASTVLNPATKPMGASITPVREPAEPPRSRKLWILWSLLFGASALFLIMMGLGIGLYTLQRRGSISTEDGIEELPQPPPPKQGTALPEPQVQPVTEPASQVRTRRQPRGVAPEPPVVDPISSHQPPTESAPPPPTVDQCGSLSSLEAEAALGRLKSTKVKCLGELMRSSSLKLTDRDRAGRVLIADGQASCRGGSGCDRYEADQRYYFREVGRYDADMMLAFADYLMKKGSKAEASTWAGRALERKDQWKGARHTRRVERAYAIRGRAAYAAWEAHPTASTRIEARNRTSEWAEYRVRINKDPKEALAMCSSAAGEKAACLKRVPTDAVKKEVRFLSVPVGAEVVVDGESRGHTPVVVELLFGSHRVQMSGAEGNSEKSITVGLNEAVRWVWNKKKDSWEPGY